MDKPSLRALREKMTAGYLLKIEEGRALLAIAEPARARVEPSVISTAPGDSTVVSYEIANPPEDMPLLKGRDLLTVTYRGSGQWEFFPVPPYYHFMQVYCVGRPYGKDLKVATPDTMRCIMSSIGPHVEADIAGWSFLKFKATRGTAWIVRICR